MKLKILVTEDGKSQRELLKSFLCEEGHDVFEAADGETAVSIVKSSQIDLVLMDFKLPGSNGLETLKEIKDINPEIDVVMMTAYSSVETAVSAMKAGAVDYLTKPIGFDELVLIIERIAERRTLVRENRTLKIALNRQKITTDQIIYKSFVMEELVNLAGRVAASRATVLIQGESGTGKELIARLIHALSPRDKMPLVTVNCAALPETLLESELFGHEKGAFTGAIGARTGRFEEADGGTLFMDEIGELSPSAQVKLLRFLQEKQINRVGSNRTITADVRVISATNRDLAGELKKGLFREDLFYRLNVVAMTIPPLRDRREDIFPLVEYFLKKYIEKNASSVKGISTEAMDTLLKYDYPGNVRELENIIERAVVITREKTITTSDLPFHADELSYDYQTGNGKLKNAIESLEKRMIAESLKSTEGHQSKAADLLGISERMFRYKLKKYGFK